MIYQLPNGKVIHISIEEYLDMTDLDIQYMMSVNAGNYAPSPWYGSVNRKAPVNTEKEIDTSIDFQEELEEPLHDGIEEELPLEDFPDLPVEEE